LSRRWRSGLYIPLKENQHGLAETLKDVGPALLTNGDSAKRQNRKQYNIYFYFGKGRRFNQDIYMTIKRVQNHSPAYTAFTEGGER